MVNGREKKMFYLYKTNLFDALFYIILKSATIIQYTIKGRFMSR